MDLLLRLLSLFFRGTGLMLGVVGAGFAIACLGGVFSDRLDAFSHFAPLWLAMGLGAIILGWVFARQGERLTIIGLGGSAVFACVILMGPELLAASGSKRLAPRADDLKVIQFNIWHENETPERALRWLLDQNADVVVIVEGGVDGRQGVLVRLGHGTGGKRWMRHYKGLTAGRASRTAPTFHSCVSTYLNKKAIKLSAAGDSERPVFV